MTIGRILIRCALSGILLVALGSATDLVAEGESRQESDAKMASERAQRAESALPEDLLPGEIEGQWFVDDEDREYRIELLPKEGAQYSWEGEGRLRYNRLVVYDVVKEDENHFYAKIYRGDAASFPARVEPTAEQLAEVAATYSVDVPVLDRVRFQPASR